MLIERTNAELQEQVNYMEEYGDISAIQRHPFWASCMCFRDALRYLSSSVEGTNRILHHLDEYCSCRLMTLVKP